MTELEIIVLMICTTLILVIVVGDAGNRREKEIELKKVLQNRGTIIVRARSVVFDARQREEIRREIEKATTKEVIVLPCGCEIAGVTLNAERGEEIK